MGGSARWQDIRCGLLVWKTITECFEKRVVEKSGHDYLTAEVVMMMMMMVVAVVVVATMLVIGIA